MKKLFVALALIGMVGSVSAITVAATSGANVVTVKGDKEKKKKKKKKKDECCSSTDSTKKEGCSKEGEKKKCCSGH
ncbi:MAG TPA: hypothetical protein VK826_12325 [Bacteroidia bacterium]|nr:hypothetical protein [Bacteroidia bacterium]